MKFFHGKGTCSLGILVVLEELGLDYDLAVLDLAGGEQRSPAFRQRSPKGKVPLLQLDDGSYLSEWTAIAVYLAASNPAGGLLPADPVGLARTLEAVDYVVATVHMQGFTRMVLPGLFTPKEADFDQVRARGREIVDAGLDLLSQRLDGQDYLQGGVTIADAALFYVEHWMVKAMGATINGPCLAHYERMLARPAVRRALARGE